MFFEESLSFSSSHLFLALAAGLVMALAFQVLLINLGVALGITLLKGVVQPSSEADSESGQRSGFPGWLVGLGMLVSVNLVLFAACFLAGKLSLVEGRLLGAILGIVLWSAYFLLVLWLSSTAFGSLLGVLGDTLKLGWRGLRAVTAPLRSSQSDAPDPELLIEERFWELQTTLLANQTAQLPAAEVPEPTADPPLPAIPSELALTLGKQLAPMAAQALLAALVKQQKGLLATGMEAIVEQLPLPSLGQKPEKPTVSSQAIADVVQTLPLDSLKPNRLRQQFRTALEHTQEDFDTWQQQLKHLSRKDLSRMLKQRPDLDEAQVKQLSRELDAVRQEVLTVAKHWEAEAEAAAEDLWEQWQDYLRNADNSLSRRSLEKTLQRLLQESSVGLVALRPHLPQLEPEMALAWLDGRSDLSKKRRQQVAERLAQVWAAVIRPLPSVEESELEAEITEPETDDRLQKALSILVATAGGGLETVGDRLPDWGGELVSWLAQNSQALPKQMAEQLVTVSTSLQEQATQLQQATQERLQAVEQQTRQQLDATRRATAATAWWLFGTALTSLVTAAIAGTLAVSLTV